MFVAIAVALGFISLGGFTIASMASAFGVEQEPTDWIRVGSFAMLALAFIYATPLLMALVR